MRILMAVTALLLCSIVAQPATAETIRIEKPEDWAKLHRGARDVCLAMKTLTVDDLKRLSTCPDLEILGVGIAVANDQGSLYVTDEHLAEIAKLKSLQIIDLVYGPATTDAGLQRLAELPALVQLDVISAVSMVPRFKWLSAFKDRNITKFWAGMSKAPVESLPEALASLTRLKSLSLTGMTYGGGALKLPGREGWDKLGSLADLEIVELSWMLPEAEMYSGLAKVPALKYLSLAHCPLDDSKRLAGVGQCATLDEVRLDGCALPSPAALDWLAANSCLKTLTISQCTGPAGCLRALGACKSLAEVTIQFAAWAGPADAQALSSAPALERLTLYNMGFSDEAMAELAKSSSLKHLALEDVAKVSDRGLAALGELKQLETLNLHRMLRISKRGVAELQAALPDCNVKADSGLPESMGEEWMPLPATHWVNVGTAAELAQIGNISEETDGISFSIGFAEKDIVKIKGRAITHVKLRDEAVSDTCAAALSPLAGLVSLDIQGGKSVGDAMLKAASQLPKLQYFVLAAPGDWSDSGVKHLAKLKELRTVNLYSNTSSAGPLPTLKLTNAAFKTLAEMPSIRSLRMGHSPKITGKCLASLGATSELMDLGLVLVGTVTPADLKGLAGLQALTRLFLMFDSVDDACLKEVAKFPALEYLELAHSSKLSDAGLLPLADAPKLANVWISNCSNLTQAGAKALRDKKTGWKVTLK